MPLNPLAPGDDLFRFFAERSPEVYWTADVDGVIRFVGAQASALLNTAGDSLVGLPVSDIIHPEDVAEASALLETLLTTANTCTLTYRLRRPSSDPVWVEATIHALRDPGGAVSGYAGLWRNITERKRIEEAFEHQAYHDALTGLPNRLLFEDRLSIALAHAKRLKTLVAVLFIDLDRLKTINDTLGHAAGDAVLRSLASRLSSSVRATDTLARVGGDEFLAVASVRHEEDAVRIARSLLEKANQPFVVHGQELFVRASIGIAIFPHDGENAARLVAAADEAMYRCKKLGGNGWQLHQSTENERALERLAIEMDLNRALERNEFTVRYQPLFDVATQEIAAVEALIRWEHPTRGELAPAVFLDVAEETRLIIPIGEKVFHLVCAQARQWLNAGWKKVSIAVNLTARQFEHAGLVETLDYALRTHDVSPSALQLEITEGTALRNLEWSLSVLAQLKERGIRVAIDDFGMGYSSLTYLKDLPVNSLKIDKTFLTNVPRSRDAKIVSAVIAMGHALGLQVIAEGVERTEQMAFLRENNCDILQGYLFSHPTTADEITRMLKL